MAIVQLRGGRQLIAHSSRLLRVGDGRGGVSSKRNEDLDFADDLPQRLPREYRGAAFSVKIVENCLEALPVDDGNRLLPRFY